MLQAMLTERFGSGRAIVRKERLPVYGLRSAKDGTQASRVRRQTWTLPPPGPGDVVVGPGDGQIRLSRAHWERHRHDRHEPSDRTNADQHGRERNPEADRSPGSPCPRSARC